MLYPTFVDIDNEGEDLVGTKARSRDRMNHNAPDCYFLFRP